MGSRRQRSGQFFRRLKTYSDPTTKPISRIRKFRNSDFWLWAEAIAFVVVAATIWQIWIDLNDRKAQRIAQAWELVTRPAPGNSGKGFALEYLNRQEIPLVGIDLSVEHNGGRSYLVKVNLPGANLTAAKLSGAYLMGADLSGAYLWNVDFSGADLTGADLSGVYLAGADLSGTVFMNADLSGADLSKVNLMNAILLSPQQLENAYCDEKTQLPKGFTIEVCSTE